MPSMTKRFPPVKGGTSKVRADFCQSGPAPNLNIYIGFGSPETPNGPDAPDAPDAPEAPDPRHYIEPFSRLPKRLLRDPNLSPAEKLVLMALECYGYALHRCRASVASIATECGLCERTVQRTLPCLIARGLIRIVGTEVTDNDRVGRECLLVWLDEATGCHLVTPDNLSGDGMAGDPVTGCRFGGDNLSPDSDSRQREIPDNHTRPRGTPTNRPAIEAGQAETDQTGDGLLLSSDFASPEPKSAKGTRPVNTLSTNPESVDSPTLLSAISTARSAAQRWSADADDLEARVRWLASQYAPADILRAIREAIDKRKGLDYAEGMLRNWAAKGGAGPEVKKVSPAAPALLRSACTPCTSGGGTTDAEMQTYWVALEVDDQQRWLAMAREANPGLAPKSLLKMLEVVAREKAWEARSGPQ